MVLVGQLILHAAGDDSIKARAAKLHESAIVFDAHAHPLYGDQFRPGALVLGKENPSSPVTFPAMKKGGLDAVIIAVPLFGPVDWNNTGKSVLNGIKALRQEIETNSALAAIALTAAEIKTLHKQGKSAIMLGIESPNFLGRKIEHLARYYDLGIRCITLADGKLDPLSTAGAAPGKTQRLSDYGKKVVSKMNRLGMLVDITHVPDQMQLDIIEFSKAPVAVTHSCLRALHDVRRNVPDTTLKALAKKGGAVMITFRSGYLSAEFAARYGEYSKKFAVREKELKEKLKRDESELKQQLARFKRDNMPTRVSIDVLIDHIDHAVKVAGVNHVGLGSDFAEYTNPVGLESATGYPLITYHLLKRGYTEVDIVKIMGGNLLRILSQVEQSRDK